MEKINSELFIILMSMLPINELRGTIPIALSMNQPVVKTLLLAIIGNLIPVGPLLVFLRPVSERLRRFKIWRRFFEHIFNHTEKKARIVQKYGALGLILFVAIPLPVTGAWTGSVAASLFKIRFRYAFSAIAVGVIISGCIVTAIYRLAQMAL
ncbi:MAG: small multi-drug export protein [Candidatus Omnitrophota bacterium]|nr:small multi-drug export protein [Candidatus Omnitrophota bacterium]